MAFSIEFNIKLYLDLESREEDDATNTTISNFVAAQSGTYEYDFHQNTEGDINVIVTISIPVADHTEMGNITTIVYNNLDTLPRSGACVRDSAVLFNQRGLPGGE